MGFPGLEEIERSRLRSQASAAIMYLRLAVRAMEQPPADPAGCAARPLTAKLVADIRAFLESTK